MLNTTYEQWLVESIVQKQIRKEVSPNKKHIALFLVVAMLLALCACTSQPAKDTTSEQTTADASSNSDAANTDDSTETAAPSGETVTIRVSGLNQRSASRCGTSTSRAGTLKTASTLS